MFIVTTRNKLGQKVPLRGTVWAFEMDRAQVFATREDAMTALAKAKKFMPAKVWRAARIEEAGR